MRVHTHALLYTYMSHPMMAKAGSSCRSKGKSIRKFVLNRAVMVTARQEKEVEPLKQLTGKSRDPFSRQEMCIRSILSLEEG